MIRTSFALLLLTSACQKSGSAVTTHAEQSTEPGTTSPGDLFGHSFTNDARLRVSCNVEIQSKKNQIVHYKFEITNNKSTPLFAPALSEPLRVIDQGGMALYVLGQPFHLSVKHPGKPVYEMLAPKESRTWEGGPLKSPTKIREFPGQGLAHEFLCSVALGPDGRSVIRTQGRAIKKIELPAN